MRCTSIELDERRLAQVKRVLGTRGIEDTVGSPHQKDLPFGAMMRDPVTDASELAARTDAR